MVTRVTNDTNTLNEMYTSVIVSVFKNVLMIVGIIVAMFLDNKLGTTIGVLPYGYIYLAYFLVTIIPGLSVLARRLHDVGKSGWMFLIVLYAFSSHPEAKIKRQYA